MPTTKKTARKKPADAIDFEKSLKKLNQLIDKMEDGNLPLDASLKNFEEGISLINSCQKSLTAAEQRVQVLTKKSGKTVLQDFESDEDL